MTLRVLGLVVGLVVGLVAAPAQADIIIQSSDEGACKSAAEGARCESREADGTCQPSTCSRRDYAKGPPGEMVEYACLRCLPVATPAPAATPAATTPPTTTPAAATPATPARPATAPAATPRPAAKGTGCQVGGGPLGLVLVGALLLALARRTRRV
jgi:cell division septation protein DedD